MNETQQQKILQLLRQMGSLGINSFDLTYRYGIKQAPTRINELKKQGYLIVSRKLPNRSHQYYLAGNATISPKVSSPIRYWEQDENLIPVKKEIMFLGKKVIKICWEKPEDIKPTQEVMSI